MRATPPTVNTSSIMPSDLTLPPTVSVEIDLDPEPDAGTASRRSPLPHQQR
ncbi:hypothetical protein [Okibacterium endophyticum]